jgi:DNA adenine methylase
MSTGVQQPVSLRPFLKWAGGKSKLIEQYIPYFPKSFKTYYEPFLGGGAVFFYLNPPSAFLADINPELVNTYHCVRDEVETLIQSLEVHQLRHGKDYYYEIRQRNGITQIERAARLIYLNKTCYNGLYRENSQGEFNVPIGKYKNPKICNSALLRAASIALRQAQIEVQSFEYILDYASGSDDFVYFDPPYYPLSTTSSFTAYSRSSFSQDDQIRLRDVFAELARRGVKAMLSNSDCQFIRQLYRDFNIYSISSLRRINSNASKRGLISEVLITSY